mmetsp:Transcript_33185/g.77566  ORF Transcript_33185/g.77566 Transcript_33185/m.77566 type:complete len:210 (-) Transcript_33185:147-776(-)
MHVALHRRGGARVRVFRVTLPRDVDRDACRDARGQAGRACCRDRRGDGAGCSAAHLGARVSAVPQRRRQDHRSAGAGPACLALGLDRRAHVRARSARPLRAKGGDQPHHPGARSVGGPSGLSATWGALPGVFCGGGQPRADGELQVRDHPHQLRWGLAPLSIERGDHDVVLGAIGALCSGNRPLPRHCDRHHLGAHSDTSAARRLSGRL